MNHDRPVYQMQTLSNDKPVIYFWDERDGPRYSGRYISEALGADAILASTPTTAPSNHLGTAGSLALAA